MKSELRIKAKDIRKILDIEKISHDICTEIRKLDIYKSAKNVMIFYPMKYEISLLELLEDKKLFFLPKINNENLVACPYDKNLQKSQMGIFEPCTNPINPTILDLIFVPALMVDKENYRLGYGGGFYDRFLSQYPNIKTIVPILKDLVVEKLPHDKWDVKIDNIFMI